MNSIADNRLVTVTTVTSKAERNCQSRPRGARPPHWWRRDRSAQPKVAKSKQAP
jgi:hypothetical protein